MVIVVEREKCLSIYSGKFEIFMENKEFPHKVFIATTNVDQNFTLLQYFHNHEDTIAYFEDVKQRIMEARMEKAEMLRL